MRFVAALSFLQSYLPQSFTSRVFLEALLQKSQFIILTYLFLYLFKGDLQELSNFQAKFEALRLISQGERGCGLKAGVPQDSPSKAEGLVFHVRCVSLFFNSCAQHIPEDSSLDCPVGEPLSACGSIGAAAKGTHLESRPQNQVAGVLGISLADKGALALLHWGWSWGVMIRTWGWCQVPPSLSPVASGTSPGLELGAVGLSMA